MLTYQDDRRPPRTSACTAAAIDVPASFAGQKCSGILTGPTMGRGVRQRPTVRLPRERFTAFNIDVTKALKPGQQNLMAVRLYKNTSSQPGPRGFLVPGGHLPRDLPGALPQLHVDDVTVVTDLDAQYKDATLKSTSASPARRAAISS